MVSKECIDAQLEVLEALECRRNESVSESTETAGYKGKIVKEVPFRSGSRGVNKSYDMVRVTIDVSRLDWRQLRKHILE